jgi:outer membrane protein OmpA-like peptidoglycan-associated protein
MRLVHKAACAAALLLPVAAGAQTTSGPYVAGAVGPNMRESFTISGAQFMSGLMGSQALPSGKAVATSRIGWTGIAAVGYGFRTDVLGFQNGIRVELEGNFRGNDIRKLKEFGQNLSNSGGSTRSFGVLANVYADAVLGSYAGIQVAPYLGVGLGYANTQFDRAHGTLAANSTNTRIDGQPNGTLAYNLMAGTSFALDSIVPGLSATLEWRYYTAIAQKVDTYVNNPGTSPLGNNATLHRVTQPNCCHDNSLLVGLRYAFGSSPAPLPAATPTPAPQPVAQAAVARTYLVFFDWDRAELTTRARDIIMEAANNTGRAGATRIEVSGHTDRSGDAAYNQRLSMRRGEAVAEELVRVGVPRTAISVQAFGETRPLIVTADGVREPQNRRVEIVLR